LSPPAQELIARLREERDEDAKWVFASQFVPSAPVRQLWAVWSAIRERASVTLWAVDENPRVRELVTSLRASLQREPTATECQGLAAAAGVKLPEALTKARIYDLRHTVASVAAAGGLSLVQIGGLLGHSQAATTQRYVHLVGAAGAHPLQKAIDLVGDAITGAGGADNVRKLRGGRS
jgi:integrase